MQPFREVEIPRKARLASVSPSGIELLKDNGGMKSRRDCNCACHSGSVVVHPVPCCDGILGYMKKKAQLDLDCKFEFPLYVCLDDGEIIRIEAPDRILYHLEAIDIENNEYQFWDAMGCPLKVLITNGQVSGLENAENKVTLAHAIEQYAEQLGVRIYAGGKPEEIWVKLETAKESLPRRPRVFSLLFGKRKT
jgi:hypothetical protein